jgi:hypothetical protein
MGSSTGEVAAEHRHPGETEETVPDRGVLGLATVSHGSLEQRGGLGQQPLDEVGQSRKPQGAKEEVILQVGGDPGGRQSAGSRRGQLDGQRQPIQTAADHPHRVGVLVV